MKFLAIVALLVCGFRVQGQDSMEKVMERRARELHRVICLSSTEEWKKFVKENYAQSLIDRPLKSRIEGPSGASETTVQSNIDGKATMLGRLHEDFGSSKIVSLKTEAESINMQLDNGDGLLGTFKLTFSKVRPYLIESIGIQVGN
jgi:hypothetical protein